MQMFWEEEGRARVFTQMTLTDQYQHLGKEIVESSQAYCLSGCVGALWTSSLLDKFMENSALDSNLWGEMHLGRTLSVIFLCRKQELNIWPV